MADLALQFMAAIKGDKGFYPSGTYNAALAYRKDAVVRYNSAQWIALQLVPPGTMPLEGVYWTLFLEGWAGGDPSTFNSYTKAQTDTLLAAKAPLSDPTLTGTVTVPTRTAGDNTTGAASTAFVKTAIDAVIG